MQTPAFLPTILLPTLRHPPTLKPTTTTPLKMTNDWPDATGPPTRLYSTKFPPSRLNKAPIITLNNFPNPSVNNISMSYKEIPVDEPQGISIKNTIEKNTRTDVDGRRKEVEKYYKGRDMNVAPVISICGGGSGKEKEDDRMRSVYVGMETVGKRLEWGKEVLEEVGVQKGPEGFWVREMEGEKAPYLRIEQESGVVGVEKSRVAMDYAGAKIILDRYRK